VDANFKKKRVFPILVDAMEAFFTGKNPDMA
jgi:hypothetical protein